MSNVTVRIATVDDVDAIMAIEAPVFGNEAWSSDAMARDVADPNCVYLVAESADGIIAYAGLLCPEGSGDGDIQTIAVIPEARTAGLGRTLMTELMTAAATRKAHRIFLEVRADNTHAIALYESLGFDEIATRPGYYQPEGVDAIVMKFESAPARIGPIGAEEVTA